MYCSKRNIYRFWSGTWRKVDFKYPSWYDQNTRNCLHQDGVIIAGSSEEGYGMKVAFLDIRNNTTVELQDLEYNLKNAGMIFDVDTGKLTIVGGETYKHDDTGVRDLTLTNVVFQLPELSNDAVWEKLKPLSDPVANPMLVSDKEHLYVLSGDDCVTCVRMSKERQEGVENEWVELNDLPGKGAAFPCEYNGNLYSGALVYDGKVTVFTRSHYLTLKKDMDDATKTNWKQQPYETGRKTPKGNINHLTPILHNEHVVAGIRREHEGKQKTRVESFKTNPEGKKYWRKVISAHKRSELGAGRILFVKSNKLRKS